MPDYKDVTDCWEDRSRAFGFLRGYYRLIIEPTLGEKSEARFYEVDGKRGPSVTTVLSVLSKPALIQWSANCAVDYIRDAIPEIISPDTTDRRIEQILKSAKSAHRKEAKKAMETGTLVHEAIETYLSGGKPESLLSGNAQAETSFLAFLEWKNKVQLEPIALEKTVFHPELYYGGTVDFIGYTEKEV